MKAPIDEERIWRCACGGTHFLSLNCLDWGDGHTYYVTVLDIERGDNLSLWGRLKAAAKLLWGRNHLWTEMLLDEEMAYQMAAWLEQAQSDMKRERLLGDEKSEVPA